jgi:uncharacterized protein with beta-barrel porin domain
MGLGGADAAPVNCTGLPLADNATIVCTGYSYYSIEGSADAATVTLNGAATLAYAYGSAVRITGDGNGVTLNDGSNAISYGGEDTVFFYGDGNTVTLNGASDITLVGVDDVGSGKYIAVGADGVGNTFTLNGASTVHVYDNAFAYDRSYAGISAYGHSNVVTLNDGSSVIGVNSSLNESVLIGVQVIDFGNGADEVSNLTLNGGSSVKLYGSGLGDGSYVLGIVAAGLDDYSPVVTLNGGSTVELTTFSGDGNKYVGVAGSGKRQSITLNSASGIRVSNEDGSNGKYIGIGVLDYAEAPDEAGAVTLNGGSFIELSGAYTTGTKYVGVLSLGVGSGSDKYASNVTLSDSHISLTHSYGAGNKYAGVMTVGAGSTVTLNGDSAITLNNSYGGGGSKYIGIGQIGYATSITMNGGSSVTLNVSGSADGAAVGLAQSADYSTIVMNGDASVTLNLDGIKYGNGISQNGYGTSLTLNDYASVIITGNVTTYSAGIGLYGDSQTVTFNDYALVDTSGASGVVGLLSGGAFDNVITLNGHSSIISNDAPAIVMAGGAYNSLTIGANAGVSGLYGVYVSDDFDTITIAGTVTGTGGIAIDTRSGSNSTVTLNSATINGDILGNGSDALILEGAGTFNDEIGGFNALTVNATGVWSLTDYAGAETVTINSGKLAVNGVLYADTITVASGGTLGGSGSINGAITVASGGKLSPGNSPGVLNVTGSLSFVAGSIFDVEVEAGAFDQVNVSGAPGTVVIAPGAILTPHIGAGVDGFSGDILTATGGITGTFTVIGGAASYTVGAVTLTATSSSSMNGAVGAAASSGFSFLDTVMGQAAAGAQTGRNLWTSVIWDESDRTGDGNSKGYSQKAHGAAFGGTLLESGSMKIGLAGGYLDGSVNTVSGGSESSSDGYHAAAYGTYSFGGTVLTAAVTAAYQDQDVSRKVLVGGVVSKASGSPEAWLGGAGVGVAHAIPLGQAFTLTPRANIGWLHLNRDGYTESGGGAAAVSLEDISTDTVRGQAGAELSLLVKDPNAAWSVRPKIHAALAQEWRDGDSNATGTFASGGAFSAPLDNRDQTYLAVGAGVDMTVGQGVTAFASYEGGFGGNVEKSGGFRLGARLEW